MRHFLDISSTERIGKNPENGCTNDPTGFSVKKPNHWQSVRRYQSLIGRVITDQAIGHIDCRHCAAQLLE